LTNEDLRTLAEVADANGREPRQELNYLIAQAMRRARAARRRRTAPSEAAEEAHAA